ncbi:GNAT family N-acetyltransferase [Pseudomonas nicosulfuronedens]|uniref:GNAT family N-acetyltransferase n=1 Tax=Pseudomonas nicosulfuronedens TaxID=2571105 RepID=A0A5R9RCR8_9PSED|nr:GNAT family N-acetyltransferase [Pseudomonas nicosulfuronedens]MDH1009229.1 GNAT family N-acetyltransferase [Pseudomonas nicosulfuronedens]MDH1978141.1 GNAT family N-acetyltransferase [Pseudomonas nicosulfuronedens]MDH2026979.1 GNAT family N-acetyltransferase [Pseudomonas nicosulfuronedens]TLX81130.1 GNAT family N-acetyltransferase [Pseudomonas nicosulfuronedens]
MVNFFPDLSLVELSPAQAPWSLLLKADPSREQIESYLPDSRLLALNEADSVRGVLTLTPREPGVAEITSLAVEDEWQERGLGRRLLLAAIEQAREAGLQRLTIATGNSSLAQLGLYQRLGFRIVGIETDHFVRHYPEPIYENGIQCRDQIRLALDLGA